jgi:hypothetical protein
MSTLAYAADSVNCIQPFAENPAYWQYKGEPVLLLGGSNDDNLFQYPEQEAYLDELKAAGINVIRNTMSARQDKGHEVFVYKKLENGKYDLNRWNDEYWERFVNCLRWCEERDIIVQIEVWDRFDYSREHWEASPWRPVNNVTYTAKESGLVNQYPEHAHRDKQPFFHSIAGMQRYSKELDVVRALQEKRVAKMLSYSLQHGNVLYCMNNETSTPVEWGLHWIKFIQAAAKEAGVTVFTTDMFDDGYQPYRSDKTKFALARPDLYQFIDSSQVNSRVFNQEHWNRFTWLVDQLKDKPRPINHTKIYSDGETNWGSGTPVDGVERFWRNLLAGAASSRFHRPWGGIGSNDIAKACIAAARKLETKVKLWDVVHRQDLLSEREDDEAYLAAKEGERYALFFTDGGAVKLDLSGHESTFELSWINIATGNWGDITQLVGGSNVDIAAPGPGPWVVSIVRQ